jgi:hypothetical protein
MKDAFILVGIALCLFSLAMIARRDWVRWHTPARRVVAKVTGHRTSRSDGSVDYAAIYRFTTEDGEHEAIDEVLSSSPQPPEGTLVDLTYPAGRPDLARKPRPAMWLMVYAFLTGTTILLAGLLTGWINP